MDLTCYVALETSFWQLPTIGTTVRTVLTVFFSFAEEEPEPELILCDFTDVSVMHSVAGIETK